MGRRDIFDILLITFVLAIIVSFCSPARAEDESLCARVKMEIQQELTFERQAFDARMRINNGLSNITLENVSIQLDFADEDGKEVFGSSDPNDNDAIFFYRLESLKNIDDISGNGTVNPESTAEIHWLIIPAPGAAKDMPQGAMYLVGATVTYLLGGEEHKTIVAPDYIYVRPMPELFLDYFLPGDVYGDDPFTSEIEPPIPFSLGVRVKNAGSGEAYEVKIDSAQPKIVSNQQGLPVHYKILSSEVNGEITDTELTVDFGQIDPGKSATARWIMSCDISGRFVDFTAYYSHSDELGGQLTSLITGTATHKLIHDVLVDLPGRDSVRDFLALDEEGSYKVYESENVDTEVHDQSTLSSLQQVSNNEYLLSTPVTDGFMYVKLTDPYNGTKIISEVIRSDGKKIKEENVWLSRHKVGSNPWEYYFNLFDYNSTGSYRVIFKDAPVELNPPVLQFMPDKHGAEEHTISFVVQASDPDGTTPSLFAAPLPVGATFTDNGNGEGTFEWTPVIGQAGDYEITFTASDGILEASQLVKIRICHHTDTDCDGMDDQWEIDHFNTLGRDGTDDYDHDGISDLKEFLYGFDPLVPEFAPSVPEISEPLDGAEVTTRTPTLTVKNSIDPDGDEIKYQFELYSDKDYRTLVDSAEIDETDSTTSWDVTTELNDNTWYFWRVRATDGKSFSLWTYGKFFVNTQNDPPGKFNISWPANDSVITTETPTIEITNSKDPDGDRISYTFEVYTQDDSSNPVTSETVNENENGRTTWQVPLSLENGSAYFIRVIATDTHGEVSEADQVNFSIDTNEHAPTSPVILEPEAGTEVTEQEVDLVVGNATDEDNDPLDYYFELDKVPTFDSSDLIQSGAIPEQAEETIWHVSNLEDNCVYYWRVKASDGSSESYWSYGSFRVNTKNDNPLVPVVKNPGQNAWVNTLSPALELHPGKDLDEDQLTYQIELYSDRKLRNLISQVESSSPVWNLPVELEDTTWYFWRARVIDEHGVSSDWTDTHRFFVRRVNQPPEITILEPQADIYTNEASVTIRWEDEDTDSNATIALYYNTQPVTENGTLIADGIGENPDGEADTYTWNIENLAEGKYYIYAVIS
ncbi:MAG TPA: calcium-binding protein, partial [Deltaproteobacteria bacterium]|nr:calcium-binding protein [Deltaproteobacteria bacterium]